MTTQTTFRQYAMIVRHFARTRAPEVLVLQASPILGSWLGGFSLDTYPLLRLGLLYIGSLALTAHIFVFNDWAGYSSDINDPQRGQQVFTRQGISRRQVLYTAIVLFICALAALAVVGWLSALLGLAIATLGFLYSGSPHFGKSAPVAGSIHHMLGGMLHFFLGYTFAHTLDAHGLLAGLFFGLVFAGGHLNQEVRDHEGDLLNGIRTNAVFFGPQQAFIASFCTFTAAYAVVTGLATVGRLPGLLLYSPILWLLHATWFWQALRRGPGYETAVWLQKRYRMLFALVGLAMLADGCYC